jgi:hypothetical protein
LIVLIFPPFILALRKLFGIIIAYLLLSIQTCSTCIASNVYTMANPKETHRHKFTFLLIFFSFLISFLCWRTTDFSFVCYSASSSSFLRNMFIVTCFIYLFFFGIYLTRSYITETEARHFREKKKRKKRSSHNPPTTHVIKSHPWAIALYAVWSLYWCIPDDTAI